MALNDILLHIDSYPEAAPDAAIDQAVDFAAAIGGTLSALAVSVDIPLNSNRVADYLIHLSDMVADEEAKSLAACRASLEHFKARARAAEVLGQALLERADLYLLSDQVARRAMTRDLCIVPLAGPYDGQMEVVEAALFNSGRPVLVFRAGEANLSPRQPGTVVVAWDASRCAARAMADALPILRLAQDVRILTILDETPSAAAGAGADALRHLKAHGIAAKVDEVAAAGRRIGEVLDTYLAKVRPDLLVMGGYGHTRLREIILGGATEHALYHLKSPVFISH
jgi:nucleotide-binding universal stress UspA family protein